MTLQGANQLRARILAIPPAFKPAARNWANETARLSESRVPSRTGRLRGSIHVAKANEKGAAVAAHFTAFFIDKGVKPHTIEPKSASGSRRGGVGRAQFLKFDAGNRTVFARKVHHRGFRGRKFRAKSAREALRKHVGLTQIIQAWNAAGGRTVLDARAGKGALIRPT